MLKNNGHGCSRAQNKKYHYSSDRPVRFNQGLRPKLVFVSKFFPVASDYVGGNSTIAAGQVSWAHQTISNETAFGKMFRFTLVGEEAGVSRRGWSSPSSHNSFVGFHREGVLSIDSLDGAPIQGGKSKDVVNNNFGFGYFDAWVPEQQPSKITKPNVDPDFGQNNRDGFPSKGSSTDGSKDHAQDGHDFARAGSKSLGIHPVSFTQSAAQVGAAL